MTWFKKEAWRKDVIGPDWLPAQRSALYSATLACARSSGVAHTCPSTPPITPKPYPIPHSKARIPLLIIGVVVRWGMEQLPKSWPGWVARWLDVCRDAIEYGEDQLRSADDLIALHWHGGFQYAAEDYGTYAPRSTGKYRYYAKLFEKMGLIEFS